MASEEKPKTVKTVPEQKNKHARTRGVVNRNSSPLGLVACALLVGVGTVDVEDVEYVELAAIVLLERVAAAVVVAVVDVAEKIRLEHAGVDADARMTG